MDCSLGGEILNTTIENLEFPCDIIKKIQMKTSLSNLKVDFISGHIIKINNTNLIVTEPHKIIVNSHNKVLLAYLYDNSDKILLPFNNIIISLTKFISIVNEMNRQSI